MKVSGDRRRVPDWSQLLQHAARMQPDFGTVIGAVLLRKLFGPRRMAAAGLVTRASSRSR
jgi:hypothetical protein